MSHHILEDSDFRKVFRRIARERLISFRDLSDVLDREGEPVRDNLRGVAEQLVEAGLVGKRQAPVSDFTTYYLTADGLSANRTVQNLEYKQSLDEQSKQSA